MARRTSALGEYVHYYTSNYLHYGVSRKWSTPQPFNHREIEALADNRIQTIKQVKPETLDILRERLKADSAINQSNSINQVNLAYNDKLNMLYEYLVGFATPNAAGAMVGNQQYYEKFEYTKDYMDLKKNMMSKELAKKYKKIYNEINKTIDKINKKGTVTRAELKVLIDQYNQISPEKFKRDMRSTNWSTLAKLQEAVDNKIIITTFSEMVGVFGEDYSLIFGSDRMQNVAYKQFNKALKETIKTGNIGKKRTSWRIIQEDLPVDLNSYLQVVGKTGNIYQRHSTADKVDIKMMVQNEEVLATVKTYKDSAAASLQSKFPLLPTLIFLDAYGKLGTHWMNLHASQVKLENQESADEALKRAISFDALVSGNPLKKGQDFANVFIHINRQKGDIEVSSTADILSNIDQMRRISISPRIENIQFNNTWAVSGPEERIARLLIQAHQINLKVSIAL